MDLFLLKKKETEKVVSKISLTLIYWKPVYLYLCLKSFDLLTSYFEYDTHRYNDTQVILDKEKEDPFILCKGFGEKSMLTDNLDKE